MVFGRNENDGEPKTVEIRTVSGERYQIKGVPTKKVGKISTAIRWANLHVVQFEVEQGELFFPVASIEMFFVHDSPVDAGEGVYRYVGDEDEDE